MAEDSRAVRELPAGERDWLAAVVADLPDDLPKLAYADWLEEWGDERAHFLRAFVKAARSMDPADFPPAEGLPEEWLDLIGYRVLERAAAAGLTEMRDRILRLARPALRLGLVEAEAEQATVGASRVGGLPDLPPGVPWPAGRDCHATLGFYDHVGPGNDGPADFLAQVNFAEIRDTQAARGVRLPETGLLSFFCSPRESEGVAGWSAIGVKAVFIPDPAGLTRVSHPLGWGGEYPSRLTFEETLDLPCSPYDPWGSDFGPEPGKDCRTLLYHLCERNWRNMFGYERELNAECRNDALTPSRRSRHLITLDYGITKLQLQIDQDDLTACNFDRITLLSVDTGG